MTLEHKSRGPKVKIPNRRMVNISLGPEHVEKARRLGRGTISVGVRKAIENFNEDSDTDK